MFNSTFWLLFTWVFLFGASWASGVNARSTEDKTGAWLIAFIIFIFSFAAALRYAIEQRDIGRKEATIACKTGECPYELVTEDDSTRAWVPRSNGKSK